MSWMIREDLLDPDQRMFINEESRKAGNIWIQGFAGSGKSILLVHTMKRILAQNPQARVAVVVFTRSLIDLFRSGISDLGLSQTISVMTYIEFVDKNNEHFDFLFCDEVQDLPAKALLEMKKRSKKIFVAGDSNQSIYDQDPRWREPVVSPAQIGELIMARPFTLGVIHRLTKSIIDAVQKLLPEMNIFGAKRDLTKVNVQIRLCEAVSEKEEVEFVISESVKATQHGDSTAILFSTGKDVMRFCNIALRSKGYAAWGEHKNQYGKLDYGVLNQYLRGRGIKMQFVGSGYGSLRNAQNNHEAILMTYHSSKGLDFENVFIPFVNSSLYLHPLNPETLFMVALTRSRKNLYLTYFGYTHSVVDRFKSVCNHITIGASNSANSGDSDEIFDF
jgi:hypothetical protein